MTPQFFTNDLSLAAYLIMRGCKLFEAKKMGKSYKFGLTNVERIEQLKVEYLNSESSKFDAVVRDLKKILHSGDFREE